MCYKSPGPRCSRHALLAYNRAWMQKHDLTSRSDPETVKRVTEAFNKAQDDYDMTPHGQDDLRQAMTQVFASEEDKQGYAKRLEHGIARRSASLRAVKMREAGDVDKHSRMEDLYEEIPADQGFPREQIISVVSKHIERYGEPLGEGRNRVVFDRGDGTVVKIPKNWDGVMDNGREVNWESDDIPLAPCHEVYMDKKKEIMAVVMEKVTPFTGSFKDLPQWTGWVDCAQVGYTKDGRLVAYDL